LGLGSGSEVAPQRGNSSGGAGGGFAISLNRRSSLAWPSALDAHSTRRRSIWAAKNGDTRVSHPESATAPTIKIQIRTRVSRTVTISVRPNHLGRSGLGKGAIFLGRSTRQSLSAQFVQGSQRGRGRHGNDEQDGERDPKSDDSGLKPALRLGARFQAFEEFDASANATVSP
jgi:hypothetical protein